MDAATEEARPYGLGCGGIVHLLLERRETAEAFLQELDVAFAGRKPLECAVVLEGAAIGTRTFARGNERLADRPSPGASERGNGPALWVEKIAPRCGLFVFGAGDDAEPLVTQASTLGWHIAVADGRAHLATRHRFPLAHEVTVLRDSDVSAMELRESDAAVVMTHSYEQDSRILAQLLPMPLLYLGVLGPRYRTLEMVKQAVKTTGGDAAEWMRKLHAPVGMDLGGDSPATIALDRSGDPVHAGRPRWQGKAAIQGRPRKQNGCRANLRSRSSP
jgi:xanthine/CO dehydrogenase XdhC/CoxF family maturation factor